MLWVLLLGCKEEECTVDGFDYPDPSCFSGEGGEDSEPIPEDEPDPCEGAGFFRPEGFLQQLCVECGSVICQYHTRTSPQAGAIELEVAAPIPTDPDWVEYHDDFSVDSVEELGWGTIFEWRTLTLTLSEDPFEYVSNEISLFNVGVAEVRAAATLEISVMDTEGTYPECFILGDDPDFTDDCIRPEWESY
jgi:hypothetical protein